MSIRIGLALAVLGAVLLLVGRVAALPIATHSIALTMLVVAGLILARALAVAPRRSMIEPPEHTRRQAS